MFLAQVASEIEICVVIAGISIYALAMMVKRAANSQKPAARKGAPRYPRVGAPQQDRLESLRRALGVDPAPTARRRSTSTAARPSAAPASRRPPPLAQPSVAQLTKSAAATELFAAPQPKAKVVQDTFASARKARAAENSMQDEFAASRQAYEEREDALKSADFLRRRMGELNLNPAQQMVVFSEIFKPVSTRTMPLPFEKTVL